jgi:hypothetical protein
MKFRIRMGVPGVKALWDDLTKREEAGTLDANELKSFKKLAKVLFLIEDNPRHNSLQTHEIEPLTRRVGFKVFQSYIENRTPAAGRVFWAYGPNNGEITILSIHPHPEDKKSRGYDDVRLSAFPK